jgi:phosphoglycolate phosphatase-like HAD superfamily hydrolase
MSNFRDRIAIVLDFDETIAKIHIDDYDFHRFSWENYLSNNLGFDFNLRPILPNLADLFSLNSFLANQIYDALDKLECDSKVAILPHTFSLFNELNKLGFPIYIISNNCEQVISAFLKNFKLENYVSKVQGRIRGVNGKPNISLFENLFIELEFVPEFIFSLGDRVTDEQAVTDYSILKGIKSKFFYDPDKFINYLKEFKDSD